MTKVYLCSCGGVFEIAPHDPDEELQSFLICPVCGELWPPPGYEPIAREFHEIEGDEEET